MLMGLGALIGLIIGRVRRGRLLSLVQPGFRALWLPVLAYGVQLAEMLYVQSTGSAAFHGAVVCLSYGLILLFLSLNSGYLAGCIAGTLGTLLNLAVIAANDFHMPVSGAVAALAGEGHVVEALGYSLADESTRLFFLGDVIPVPLPIIGGMASIGDVLLMAGICLLIAEAMGTGERTKANARRGALEAKGL